MTLMSRLPAALLAKHFLDGVRPRVVTCDTPEGDQSRAGVIRGKTIRGYPYRVAYTVEPDAILILGYVYERREPD